MDSDPSSWMIQAEPRAHRMRPGRKAVLSEGSPARGPPGGTRHFSEDLDNEEAGPGAPLFVQCDLDDLDDTPPVAASPSPLVVSAKHFSPGGRNFSEDSHPEQPPSMPWGAVDALVLEGRARPQRRPGNKPWESHPGESGSGRGSHREDPVQHGAQGLFTPERGASPRASASWPWPEGSPERAGPPSPPEAPSPPKQGSPRGAGTIRRRLPPSSPSKAGPVRRHPSASPRRRAAAFVASAMQLLPRTALLTQHATRPARCAATPLSSTEPSELCLRRAFGALPL